MNLKQPAQYYWTTLIDQYQSHQGLSFAFVPTRSFANNEVPSLEDVATALGTTLFIREIAPWHIPAVLATLLPGTSPNPVDAVVQLTSGSSIFVQPTNLGSPST